VKEGEWGLKQGGVGERENGKWERNEEKVQRRRGAGREEGGDSEDPILRLRSR